MNTVPPGGGGGGGGGFGSNSNTYYNYCPGGASGTASMSATTSTTTTANSSSSSCPTCIAVLSFVLGTIGGYLLSVALGATAGGGGGGGSRALDTGDGKRKEIDDEGNVVTVIGGALSAAEKESSSSAKDDDDDGDDETKGRGTLIVEGEEETTTTTTTTSPKGQPPTPSSEDSSKPIRIVVQRFRTASLLLSPPTKDAPDGVVATIGQKKPSSSDGKSMTSSSSPSPLGGIVIYISFAKGATTQMLYNAAMTVLNLPVLTRGVWGDGNKTESVLKMASSSASSSTLAKKKTEEGTEVRGGNKKVEGKEEEKEEEKEGVAVVIVPQANLISKVKNNGKSIQYHSQIDKTTGEHLYHQFVHIVKLIALDHQFVSRSNHQTPVVPASIVKALENVGGTSSCPSLLSTKKTSGSATAQQDASIPPNQMFLNESLYSSWDDSGFPLKNVSGELTTKSARKKMKKLYEAQKKRHEKYLAASSSEVVVKTEAEEEEGRKVKTKGKEGEGEEEEEAGGKESEQQQQPPPPPNASQEKEEEEEQSLPELDPTFVQVISGTFGNRQGMEFQSDMGPFCHVLNLG